MYMYKTVAAAGYEDVFLQVLRWLVQQIIWQTENAGIIVVVLAGLVLRLLWGHLIDL